MNWLILLPLIGAINVRCEIKGHRSNPVVTVKQGELQGSIETLLDGRTKYFSFKGIPYAAPPLGELRFRAPQPPKSWTGIRNATAHGSVCTQYESDTDTIIEGSEDCLFLNVYTRSLTTRAPVMVYIHGGSFMSGSGNTDTYGPEFLIKYDVILVTLNYRLEVLGFLSLDIPEVPGNAGMKDQVAALRWVKENIQQFGGDPDKVTIFGESSGAAAITYHLLSPMSRGLSQRAIAQSGVCIQDWAIARGTKERAFRVAKLLGKDTNDVNELLNFLRSVPATKLANVTMSTRTADEQYRGLPELFVPNIEKQFNDVESFISEQPIDILLAKKVNAVPLMIGYNSGEGLLLLQDQLTKSEVLNAHPSFLVPKEIAETVTGSKIKEFGERIMEYYTGNKGLSNDTAASIVNMQTDLYFSYQTQRFIHLYSGTNQPIYMYRFEYETDLNVLKIILGLTNMAGACHADDLFYLFYNEFNRKVYSEQERLRSIVDGLARLWTNFAKTGNPTPSRRANPKWHPFTAARKEYLSLNEVMTNGLYADRERIEFWNRLYRDSGLTAFDTPNSN